MFNIFTKETTIILKEETKVIKINGELQNITLEDSKKKKLLKCLTTTFQKFKLKIYSMETKIVVNPMISYCANILINTNALTFNY